MSLTVMVDAPSYFRTLAITALLYFKVVPFVVAQTDSLATLYNQSANADERARLAFAIASRELFSNPALATKYLVKSINDSSKIEDKWMLAKCYKALAVGCYFKGLYDSSLYLNGKALIIFTEKEDEAEIFSTRKNRALSLTAKGDYALAIAEYMESLAFEKSKRDTSKIIGTLNDIGNAYLKMNNYNEGMEFQREALHYLHYFHHPATLGNVLNSIGYIYDRGKINMDSAIYYYTESLKIKEQHGNIYSRINTMNNLCSCYDLKDMVQATIDCFKKLLQLQKEAEDHTGMVRSYMNLSVASQAKKNYTETIAYLNEAKNLAEFTTDLSLIADVYYKLSQAYRDQGQFRPAWEALEKHLVFKDSAFYAKRHEQTVEMAAKYDLEKKNRTIAETNAKLAKTENEGLRNVLKVRNRNFLIAGLASALLLGGSVTLIFTQKLRHKKDKEKAEAVLAEHDRGLKAIIEAQEEERHRISKDLHDGVGQQLSGVKMKLESLLAEIPDDRLREKATGISKHLWQTSDDVRTISHQMMPRSLTELGLVPALNDLLNKTFEFTPIKCSFEHHHAEQRFDNNVEISLYRIAQELISNIIKHACAKSVSVQLFRLKDNLMLTVEDDGKGLGHNRSNGHGLMNIRSRVNTVKGSVAFEPAGASGTLVTVSVPLSQS